MSWTDGKLLVTWSHELLSYALLDRNRIQTPLFLFRYQDFQPDRPLPQSWLCGELVEFRSQVANLLLVAHARLQHAGERTAWGNGFDWSRVLMSLEKSTLDPGFGDREPKPEVCHCHALNPRQMAATGAQKQQSESSAALAARSRKREGRPTGNAGSNKE
jgi:hypothetical protein